MIETLGSWVRGLAIGGIFCAVVLALAPEGSPKRAVKISCALLLTLLLLSPLASLDGEGLGELLTRARLMSQGLTERAEELSLEACRSLIRAETEEYIWTIARRLGISTLGIRLELRDGEELPYPWAIELMGEWTEEQRRELSSLLAGELGIEPERQMWSTEDAD